jgi:hypothetical protein
MPNPMNQMRIDYANDTADFQSYVRLEWEPLRAKRRSDYYSNAMWYTAVLVLGVYAAYTSEHFFLIAIFLVLLGFYWKQSGSFSRAWETQIQNSAAIYYPETQNTLELNDDGLVEKFSGLSISIPWKNVTSFTRFQERFFIRYVPKRMLLIPERNLSADASRELAETLKQHGIQEEPGPS